jgi:hypothetical protein
LERNSKSVGILSPATTQDSQAEPSGHTGDRLYETQFPQLHELLKSILFSGVKKAFSSDEKYIQIASMFNFVKDVNGSVVINSRLMETRLYNLFIGEEETNGI